MVHTRELLQLLAVEDIESGGFMRLVLDALGTMRCIPKSCYSCLAVEAIVSIVVEKMCDVAVKFVWVVSRACYYERVCRCCGH